MFNYLIIYEQNGQNVNTNFKNNSSSVIFQHKKGQVVQTYDSDLLNLCLFLFKNISAYKPSNHNNVVKNRSKNITFLLFECIFEFIFKR